MKTSTIIEYGAFDIRAKPDSSITITNKQTFSDILKLKRSDLTEIKYSTLEKNLFVLDGESENMGTTTSQVAWWSNSMSDSNGDFTTPLVMTITFSQSHSSIGLTLKFSKFAYCNNLKIQYYDSSDSLLSEETFNPDDYEYFCEDTVSNYRKIIVTFYSTNIPYRYLKLYKIVYGKAILFESENLVKANILEQVNLLSDELSINTLDFTVYADDDRFNILNPQGVFSTISQGQSLNVYQKKGDEINNMGTFYIDSWESKNDNKMEFNCVDIIGLLEKGTYYGGIENNTSLYVIIFRIFISAGIPSSSYIFDSSLNNITISGYIPVCTCREALQQVLFTVGGIANCARSDKIKLYKLNESESPLEIKRSNIFKGTEEIKRGDIITGVSITTHSYTQGTEQKTLFEGHVEYGATKIIFENPTYNLSITGTASNASIRQPSSNYAYIDTLSAGDVVVKGYEYVDNTQNVFIQNSSLIGNEKPNILEIDNLYIANNSNAQDIGQRILDHYNGMYTSKFKFILDDEKTADNVTIEEKYNNILNGFITELDIDLTGGYIVNAEVVAKVRDD